MSCRTACPNTEGGEKTIMCIVTQKPFSFEPGPLRLSQTQKRRPLLFPPVRRKPAVWRRARVLALNAHGHFPRGICCSLSSYSTAPFSRLFVPNDPYNQKYLALQPSLNRECMNASLASCGVRPKQDPSHAHPCPHSSSNNKTHFSIQGKKRPQSRLA